MNPIQADVPLKPYTTFKIGGPARYFASASTEEEFRAALDFARRERLPIFVLGGGSNIVVSDRGFSGLVVHPSRQGIEPEDAGTSERILRIQAGEVWDDVVRLAVKEGLWGIENLSHIPGQAGAALVQNIGAYGRQVADTLESAEVMSLRDGRVRALTAVECGFAYRRSIFNSTAKNEFIILSLALRLRKDGQPDLRYPDLQAHFAARGPAMPSLGEIREAIIGIRDRKFPFPREEKGGNAGSFFKNLLLGEEEFAALERKVQRNFGPRELDRLNEIRRRSSPAPIKVPAAFLIEICGLKGCRGGGAEVNQTQPLVLLNQGGATADDVLALAGHVRRTVRERTGATLALEPELVGFTREEIANALGSD